MKWVLLGILIATFTYICLLNINRKTHTPKPRLVKRLPPPRKAMTIVPFGILIKADEDSETIRKHEECHWQQYQELGLLRFYAKYFGQYIKNGYRENTLEEQCYLAENG